MLAIEGESVGRFCDRISRRELLQIGALGLGFGSLNLADMLGAEARSGIHQSRKSVINIHLEGGPPQMDTWDMKPEGPVDLRGEFRPIKTNVSGIEISEWLPRLSQLADKYSIIRSVVGNVDAHNFDTTQHGYPNLRMKNAAMREIGGAPAVGSIISKLLGPRDGAPAFVWDCMGGSQEGVQPGYLGAAYRPFVPQTTRGVFQRRLPAERVHDRMSLLKKLDALRREMDAKGEWKALDSFNQQAIDMILSGKVGVALDLNREDPRVRDRFAEGAGRYRNHTERFLLARRLVEAGVRYVALNWGGYLGFDSHEQNYPKMRSILPPLDVGLAALIEDLYQRGMDQDTLIVVWAEFGRTPKINKKGGRDHWPPVQCALMIGGGLKMGQVIGATDHAAGEPTSRPVHAHEVISTIYRHLGIDPRDTQLIDPSGRPRYLLDVREPIHELL
ncbi:MAG: DUF1501 domain-containing protein [Pirellulales bacterium]